LFTLGALAMILFVVRAIAAIFQQLNQEQPI
jgi:hypothetical protein